MVIENAKPEGLIAKIVEYQQAIKQVIKSISRTWKQEFTSNDLFTKCWSKQEQEASL